MTIQPFISELIRAANQVERLSELERARLLDRAGRTIKDMRDETSLGSELNCDGKAAAWEMRVLARMHGKLPDAEVSKAMLSAVQIIKTLQMTIDAKRRP